MEPLVAIVGETASGKSELALHLAEKFGGEIIAADAMTIYKGFTIGTAKPGLEDQKRIKHHLLDIAAADEGFSAARYQQSAHNVIEDIHKRKKLPIMVGGSGLYINSVLFEYDFRNEVSLEQRKKLEIMSLAELQKIARTNGLDLDSIDSQNKRRIIRLIETGGAISAPKPLREHTLVIALSTDRSQLLQSVEHRVDSMIEAGLEQEVKSLSESYGWDVEPMKSIGYREWHAYFDGSRSLDETRQQIITDTMRLAKKQRTWFRRNKSIHWITEQREAVELVTTLLNR